MEIVKNLFQLQASLTDKDIIFRKTDAPDMKPNFAHIASHLGDRKRKILKLSY